ncbi:NUDIX domain-containing protein [Paenibacillus alkalitolerans]|uniref:NUDIX domain-containing protein n=1 Tax=Paenibacillus alkalitolerans TaxID=2799335 RepID=UPI0018F6AECF|nr:NUDIX domain-containing protein [Paenibacillus alkalitolerans]
MKHYVRLRAAALVIENDAILLIEFQDENGLHYNLPAGGMEPGETLIETAIREAREEASAEIEVGPVAFVYQYEPVRNRFLYGEVPSVGVTFACKLKEGSVPKMPDHPDPNQVGVKWVQLSELKSIQLYPEITQDILDYSRNRPNYRNFVEEQTIQLEKVDCK